MESNLLISVVVLSYNQEKFIRQTLDSILGQVRNNFQIEINIGDDCSKDSTRKIILDYQSRYPDLIFPLPEEPNKGVMKNFRDTLKKCRGKYIAICAGDDYWHDNYKLEKQLDFLEKNLDYGLVFTDINCFFEDKQVLIENYVSKYDAKIYDGNVFETLFIGDISINALTVCFRREDFEKYVKVDEFIEAGLSYDDLPSWLELSRHTKFKYFNYSTSTYRVITNSLSHSDDIEKKLKFLNEHYKIKRFFIDKYNIPAKLIDKLDIYFQRKIFTLAYQFGDYKTALAAYNYLKSKGEATSKMKIRKILLQNPFLRKVVKYFLSIFKKNASLFTKA